MSELITLQDLIDLWCAHHAPTPDSEALCRLLGHLKLATLRVGYMSQHLETPEQFKLLAEIWFWALREGHLDELRGEGFPDDP